MYVCIHSIGLFLKSIVSVGIGPSLSPNWCKFLRSDET